MATPIILRRGGSPTSLRRGDVSPRSVGRIDPWNDFVAMDRIFENFFRNPLGSLDRTSSNGQSALDPQFELYEKENELVAYMFVPALDASTLDITATPEQVTIRGERKAQLTSTEGITSHTPWLGQAMSTGTISSSFTLPSEIDPNKVNATYKDGVLEIHLAKNEAAKPKQVKVQVNQ
jgi:HSP20 family protein